MHETGDQFRSKKLNALQRQIKSLPSSSGQFKSAKLNSLKNSLQNQQREEGSFLNKAGRFAARTGKSIASGIGGGLIDTASLAYNLPVAGINYSTGTNLPMIPSATEGIDKGIDTLTGGYTKTPENEKVFHEGLKVGGSVLGLGGVGAIAGKLGSKAIQKGASYLGSTRARDIAGGVAAGSTSEAIREGGYGEGTALAGGLAVGLGTGIVPTLGQRATHSLRSKGIDLNAAEAAERLGVSYPKNYAKNSKVIPLAESVLRKAPIAGSLLETQYTKMGKDVQRVVRDLENKVGEPLSLSLNPAQRSLEVGEKLKEGVEKVAAQTKEQAKILYDVAEANVPHNAKYKFQNVSKAIDDVLNKINTTSTASDAEKSIKKYVVLLQRKIKMGDHLLPFPVKEILKDKITLGNKIKNWHKNPQAGGGGFENLLRSVRHSMLEDLEGYGKIAPDWYKEFKKADKYYETHRGRESLRSKTIEKILEEPNDRNVLSHVKEVSDLENLERMLSRNESDKKLLNSVKRAKVESILSGEIVDNAGQTSYTGLRNAFGDPQNHSILQHILGKENTDKLEDLRTLAETMVNRSRKNPNPSGTAGTAWLLSVLGSAAAGSGGYFFGLGGAAGGLATAALPVTVLYQVATNKALLNRGIRALKAEKSGNKNLSKKYGLEFDKKLTHVIGEDAFRLLSQLGQREIAKH